MQILTTIFKYEYKYEGSYDHIKEKIIIFITKIVHISNKIVKSNVILLLIIYISSRSTWEYT